MRLGTWGLALVEDERGVARSAALLPDGGLVEIAVLPQELLPIAIVQHWAEFGPRLRDWSPDNARAIAGARLLAPLRFPPKVVCVGANYSDHRAEMATAQEETQVREPFFLLKPPTTSVIGPNDVITIRGVEDRVDWEAEVGVVIGSRAHAVSADDAMDHVAGYLLVNDVSARGAHARANPMHPAFAFDWVASKGQDSFCPIGPAIVPSWFIDNGDDIPFSLRVNGTVEQDGTTANLIADLRRLIASLSRIITLEAGDVVATGTPGGVGMAKGRFLSPGDVVELSSPMLGSFSNRVALR